MKAAKLRAKSAELREAREWYDTEIRKAGRIPFDGAKLLAQVSSPNYTPNAAEKEAASKFISHLFGGGKGKRR